MLKYKFINVDDDDEEMLEIKKKIEDLMERKSQEMANLACMAQTPEKTVSVTVNLKAELIDIDIADEMLFPDKKEHLIDLIVFLYSEAVKRADEVYAKIQNEIYTEIDDITEGKIDVKRVSANELKEVSVDLFPTLNKKLN